MKTINVLKGLKYSPSMFMDRMAKSKKLPSMTIEHVNTVFSLCWIFQFRVGIQATKNTRRYAGYYAGFDEVVMTPGKLAMLPNYEVKSVEEVCILADKLSEKEALQRAWDYNKRGIIRKFKNLYAFPELDDYKVERVYKPLYVFEFTNSDTEEKKYKALDSL
ncbi:MAG: hypothetical protein Q4B78_04915, partial [Bacillota bacterium]|nr:hypothetical protein [Bacillota bacterium]